LLGKRIWEFWFPNPAYGWFGRSISFMTLLSIPGLFIIWRKNVRLAVFTGAVFILYPLLYYFNVSDYRYRYPILWLSLIFAGYSVSLCAGALKRRTDLLPVSSTGDN
jgi:hypothetical protein